MRLSKLQRMDPIEFERYVGSLFRRMGYRVEDTQASADEGVDLVLRRGRRLAVVQCKRYQGSVGQPVVRDLYGAMMHAGAAEAYLVTTGTITRAARRWAEDKPIHLVDGHRLVEWSRTNRLNYDKPAALARGNRQFQYFLALVALAIVAVYAVHPQGLLQLRQNVQSVFVGLGDGKPTPTSIPSPTPTRTPTSVPSATPSIATPTVARLTPAPSFGRSTPIPGGGVRPGPTVIVTVAPGSVDTQ